MIEIKGNIFDFKGDAICITTNGIVKKNGDAVMGAEVALQAKKLHPSLPQILGNKLKSGNKVHLLTQSSDYYIVSFPTKDHWKDKSHINLIKNSILELVHISNDMNWNRVCVPRPGCFNGQLNWEKDVKKYMIHLDDRFYVISND
jgi:hypothetical protein